MKIKILSIVCLFACSTLLLARTYSTNFPLTENPISEGGNWINGKANGNNWSDARTTPGFAFGTETGSNGFDDSTAVVGGAWSANQTACATAHIAPSMTAPIAEIELRLRSTITAGSITGYEINFSVTSNPYIQIVRWNGPFGSFEYVASTNGPGIHNGDRLCASIATGTNNVNTIKVTINGGSPILTGTDSTFANGSPGIGFYLQGGTSANDSQFGWSSFTATDSSTTTTPPAAPTGLNVTVH